MAICNKGAERKGDWLEKAKVTAKHGVHITTSEGIDCSHPGASSTTVVCLRLQQPLVLILLLHPSSLRPLAYLFLRPHPCCDRGKRELAAESQFKGPERRQGRRRSAPLEGDTRNPPLLRLVLRPSYMLPVPSSLALRNAMPVSCSSSKSSLFRRDFSCRADGSIPSRVTPAR